MLLPIFEFPHKNKKNTKEEEYIYIYIYIYIRKKSKKIIGARKGCCNVEKWPKIG